MNDKRRVTVFGAMVGDACDKTEERELFGERELERS